MANLKFGSLVTSGIGTIGGHVMQRTNAGVMLRTYKRQNPINEFLQPQNRNYFSATANLWLSLSNTQRQSWVAAAATYTFYDNFGQPFNPTPYQLFMHVNGILLKNEQAQNLTGDIYSTIVGTSATISDMHTVSETCPVVLAHALAANTFFILQVCKPNRIGNNYRQRKWLFAYSYYTLFGTTFDAFLPIKSAVGDILPAGYQILYRYQLLSAIPFAMSNWIEGTLNIVS
jgi:hypothetical protein